MADTHEVYPNAPLALVAVEVRFPEAPSERALPMPLQRSFRDLLGEDWVIESHKIQQVEFAIGPGAPGGQTVQQTVVPRFTLRDRTLAVALTDSSLTVETTNYRHYLEFRTVLRRVFAAAAELLQPDGVARVGMRYIDEIRVAGIEADRSADWREWLDPSLLPPQLDEMVRQEYQPAAPTGLAHHRGARFGVAAKSFWRRATSDGLQVLPRSRRTNAAMASNGILAAEATRRVASRSSWRLSFALASMRHARSAPSGEPYSTRKSSCKYPVKNDSSCGNAAGERAGPPALGGALRIVIGEPPGTR